MSTRPLFFAAALVLGLAPLGCSAAATDEATLDEGADALTNVGATLTDADNGKTIAVNEGKQVVVNLASNPTTGYDWAVTSTDKSFGYPTTKFFPASKATGSGGTTRLVWSTKTPFSLIGQHKVVLSYKRAWESKAAAKTFSFTIDVRPANAKLSVNLDEKSAGKTVSVTKGQTVVLTLPSNPTTGYDWNVVQTDKSFGYPDETFVPGGPQVGSGGSQVFTWSTNTPFASGTHTVKLGYSRSWEKTALKTYEFTVDVSQ
jgi:inhibitor of cysteine peptidase